MKSPFPGMDPFLERHWEDVHARLISYIADEIQPQLHGDLVARMEERVYVEDDSYRQIRKPDVRIVIDPAGFDRPGESSVGVLDEPILLEAIGDPIRQRNIAIYDSADNRMVSAIELLSPWNKATGEEVETYLEKRQHYIDGETNLVEIDLVRAGNWQNMVGPYLIPQWACTTYRVTISPAHERGPLLYPIALPSRLPTVKVPLRPNEAPAKLELQSLIERVYRMGRYDRIRYDEPLDPPPLGPEKDWIVSVLK